MVTNFIGLTILIILNGKLACFKYASMFSGKAKKLVASNVLRVLYKTWLADTRGHFAGRLVCEKDWGEGRGMVRF